MQIQVNTDNNIEGSDGLARHVQTVVTDAMDRFSTQITRIEVHLSDENSEKKAGGDDKRCLLEARLAGLQPIAVSSQAPTLELAIDGAVDKLERAVDSAVGKLAER